MWRQSDLERVAKLRGITVEQLTEDLKRLSTWKKT
jgi:hypothetical protein